MIDFLAYYTRVRCVCLLHSSWLSFNINIFEEFQVLICWYNLFFYSNNINSCRDFCFWFQQNYQIKYRTQNFNACWYLVCLNPDVDDKSSLAVLSQFDESIKSSFMLLNVFRKNSLTFKQLLKSQTALVVFIKQETIIRICRIFFNSLMILRFHCLQFKQFAKLFRWQGHLNG